MTEFTLREGSDGRRHGTQVQSEDEQVDEFFAGRGVDMDAHRAIFESIRAASLLVAAMEERALRPLGLTHSGYRVLSELWIKGPRQPRDLAAFMMVSRPSIVGTIDTLQATGLVSRSRSTTDRRRVTVALTSAGLETIQLADSAWHESQVRVLDGLDVAEKRDLAELSRRVARSAVELRSPGGKK